MTDATIITEPPTTDAEMLKAGGDTFAAKQAERASKIKEAAPPAVAPPKEAAKPSEDKIGKPPEKKDTPKGKTPLDLPESKPKEAAQPNGEDADLQKALTEELPANISTGAKSSNAALRKGYERERAKSDKMAAELAELRGKAPAPSPELEARLKQAEDALKERDALIERVAFEHSAPFQRFNAAEAHELSAAKSYLEGSEIDPNVIEVAARTTNGAKRLEILSNAGMDANAIAAVTSHLREIDAINREKTAALENRKGLQSQWEAEHRAAQEKQASDLKAYEDKVIAGVERKISENLLPYRILDDNPEWNATVQGRLTLARNAIDGKLPLPDVGEIIYKGIAYDLVVDSRDDILSKYNDLLANHERVIAASPGAAGTSADRVGHEPSKDPMEDAGRLFEAQRAQRARG